MRELLREDKSYNIQQFALGYLVWFICSIALYWDVRRLGELRGGFAIDRMGAYWTHLWMLETFPAYWTASCSFCVFMAESFGDSCVAAALPLSHHPALFVSRIHFHSPCL